MSRIIDLTLAVKSGMRGVKIETARILEKDGWNAETLHLYSHAGTHMDAPIHFGVSDETVDRIALDRCMAPAWIVDLTGIAPHSLITRAHVANIEAKIEPGEGLLLKTCWSAYVNQDKYRNELPRVSVELARWCAEHRLAILGVEPPSVADVNNIEELSAVHRILMAAGIIIVEGLTNLDAITKEKVTFMAWPLKIADGDGAPVRALAVED
jgi:kynurenine formamidase